MSSRRTVLLGLAAALALASFAPDRAGAGPERRYRLHVTGMT